MARWKPNAQNRLVQSALELFTEQGFNETTVEQIAKRADLTTRTFFRHFSDKREVLFMNDEFRPNSENKMHSQTSETVDVMNLINQGLIESAQHYENQREMLKVRQKIIDSDKGLLERELRKREELRIGLTCSFALAGVSALQAELAAKVAMGIFTTAMTRWIYQPGKKKLTAYVQEAMVTFYHISKH
jgi:AcrR family transcriptional regulator